MSDLDSLRSIFDLVDFAFREALDLGKVLAHRGVDQLGLCQRDFHAEETLSVPFLPRLCRSRWSSASGCPLVQFLSKLVSDRVFAASF